MSNKSSLCRLLLAVLSIGAMLFLSGCDITFFNPKGAIAVTEKKLFITATLLMLIVVVPVIFMIIIIPWKYRASNKHATYKPNWAHSTALEIVWWTIPIIIIGILALVTWYSTHELDPYKPLESNKKPVTIQVIALDWKWLFIYPEQNIATVNFIQIPVNTPINFKITSDAPMNSFMIPQLGSQIYAMQGMQTKLHLIANEIGDYRGQSTNYSGDGFAGMQFIARASSKEDFTQWVESISVSKHRLSASAYRELAKPSEYNNVEFFSSVEPNLFEDTIIKFMVPDMRTMDMNPTQEIQL